MIVPTVIENCGSISLSSGVGRPSICDALRLATGSTALDKLAGPACSISRQRSRREKPGYSRDRSAAVDVEPSMI